MSYTLIDPEEHPNMDYNISDRKYNSLSLSERMLYEEDESDDDEELAY